VPYELNKDRTNWCPGWESNPHEEKSPEDFKSSASAIPPPGRRQYKLSESKELVQYWRWIPDSRKIQRRRRLAEIVGNKCC
jgi:hypothetical protein